LDPLRVCIKTDEDVRKTQKEIVLDMKSIAGRVYFVPLCGPSYRFRCVSPNHGWHTSGNWGRTSMIVRCSMLHAAGRDCQRVLSPNIPLIREKKLLYRFSTARCVETDACTVCLHVPSSFASHKRAAVAAHLQILAFGNSQHTALPTCSWFWTRGCTQSTGILKYLQNDQ